MAEGDGLQELRELRLHYETLQDLTSTLSVREVLDRLLNRALEYLDAEIGSILLTDPDGGMRIAAAAGLPSDVVHTTRMQVGQGISGFVLTTGRPLLIENIEDDDRFRRRNHERYYTKSLISAPIRLRNQTRGVINANNKRSRASFDAEDLRVLEGLSAHAAVALGNAEDYERLLERAERDGLTGLSNHAHFWSCLEAEGERAKRYARELSVVMIDVDHFKEFNDSEGHIAGDGLLVALADLIRQSCRGSDQAARYGGDEFAVVLPETSREGAVAFSEKIREAVQSKDFRDSKGNRVTVSIGAATFPHDGATTREVLDRADHYLYQSKEAGRNAVRYRD